MVRIIIPHPREVAPRSIVGKLRRNLMCRRIHAVAELPHRCLAPMSERWYRPLLVLLILTPALELRPMLSCPPSEVISVVAPERFVLGIHRD
jgi:hypothetical protein